jgi:hypothetical protein
MTPSRFVSIIIIGLAFVSSLSGCAAFRGGGTEAPQSWPISKTADRPSISLLVSGEALINGEMRDVPQQAIAAWEHVAEKAYRESGVFSDVRIGAADTDLRAEIHMLDRGEASIAMALLSGLTLTLIPTKAEDEMVMKTTLKNKAGRQLGVYEKKETVSTWIQFFLIFMMPFYSPGSVVQEVLYDLNRATINQALQTGALQARAIEDAIARWVR